MEYFLPLSVLAMIISSISFYLIDNDKATKMEPKNESSPSNPTDSMDEPTVSDSEKNPHKNTTIGESSNEAFTKYSSTKANLKDIHTTFSMLWITTQ